MPKGGGKMKYIVIIALIATIAMGYTYHGAYLLDGPVAPPSAEILGMGGLRVLPPENSANLIWAPAALPKKGISVGVNLSLTHVSESRALPLFDSFDNQVAWTPYVSMLQTYPDFAITASYGFEGEWIPTIALGYAPLFDARYIYREQVRGGSGATTDVLLGVWSIDSDGGLAGPSIGISEAILEYATIGLSASILSGTLEMSRSRAVGDSITHNAEPWEAPFDSDTLYSAELSGTMISLSAIITPTERWQIGLRYTPKTDLGESLYMDFLPSRLGIGVGYRPSGYVMSRIVAEAEMVGYGALADEDSAFAVLEDAWEFRLGMEHILPKNVPLRIGAFYRKIPLADPIAKSGFTIGSGVAFGPAVVDFAASYEMSRYSWHDQFPNSWLGSSSGDRENLDRVEEGILTGSVSIKVEF